MPGEIRDSQFIPGFLCHTCHRYSLQLYAGESWNPPGVIEDSFWRGGDEDVESKPDCTRCADRRIRSMAKTSESVVAFAESDVGKALAELGRQATEPL